MDLKELLKAQGLDDTQIKGILGAMKENKIYTTTEENIDTRYAKLKEQKEDLDTQLKNANDTIKGLKDLEIDNKDLKGKIDKFELDKAAYEKQLADKDLTFALDSALKDAKSKNNKLVKALIDMDKVKLVDGKLEGLNDQIESIKKENDFLFEKVVNGAPDFFTGGKGSNNNNSSESLGTTLGKQKAEQLQTKGILDFVK